MEDYVNAMLEHYNGYLARRFPPPLPAQEADDIAEKLSPMIESSKATGLLEWYPEKSRKENIELLYKNEEYLTPDGKRKKYKQAREDLKLTYVKINAVSKLSDF